MSTTATPDTISETVLGEMIDAIFEDLWTVTIWNDDVTTFEQVILALVVLFKHTPEEAEETAWKVHRAGKAVAATLPKKDAEKGLLGLKEAKIQATMEKA